MQSAQPRPAPSGRIGMHEDPEPRPCGGPEGQPSGREVGRRVAGGHVAEVDHGGEPPASLQEVRRVQVAVQPERRPGPPRRGERRRPDRPQSTGLRQEPRVEPGFDGGRPLRQRHPADRVARHVERRRPVQRREEGGHVLRQRDVVAQPGARHGRSLEPRHDRPRPREQRRGATDAHGDGHGDGQPRGEHGQHLLLVPDELGSGAAARHPHGQPVAEPEDRVVPAVRDEPQALAGEIRVLVDEQRPHEPLVDIDVGGRGGHGPEPSDRLRPSGAGRTVSRTGLLRRALAPRRAASRMTAACPIETLW